MIWTPEITQMANRLARRENGDNSEPLTFADEEMPVIPLDDNVDLPARHDPTAYGEMELLGADMLDQDGLDVDVEQSSKNNLGNEITSSGMPDPHVRFPDVDLFPSVVQSCSSSNPTASEQQESDLESDLNNSSENEVIVSENPVQYHDGDDLGDANVFHMSTKVAIREHGDIAREAIRAELVQLVKEKKALRPMKWSEFSREDKLKLIRSHMFVKAKYDAKGDFEKMKARLVAHGSKQDPGLYPDRSAPTAKLDSIMMVLAAASHDGHKMAVVDITGAYLEADMEGEPVFVSVDKENAEVAVDAMPHLAPYLSRGGTLTFQAMKALYGCIQSAKLWYNMLMSVLGSMGFIANQVDFCVLHMHRDECSITVVVFVDDILVTSTIVSNLEWTISELKKRFAKVTAKVDVTDFSYLGMRVRLIPGAAVLTMDGFVGEMLAEYPHVQECWTPAKGDLFTIGESEPLGLEAKEQYHSVTAKLLYYGLRVKPEIQLAVSYLTTRVQEPNRGDHAKLMRVLGYVKKTRDTGITLRTDGALKLRAYVDASFGCHDDGKSHTGMCVMLGRAMVYARSTKQKLVTLSSTESEIVGASDRVKEVLVANDFLLWQGYSMETPELQQDNESAMEMFETGCGKDRSKHMRVRKFHLKELLDTKVLTMRKVDTKVMIADLMAKPSQGSLFRSLTQAVTNNDTEMLP